MVRLRGEDTKNGRPRCIPLSAECVRILTERKRVRDEKQRNFPFVFFYEYGGRLCVLDDFRTAWEKAAAAIGRPGLLLHDFRRSFVRNATRAGVPQNIVQACSGHLTSSVFSRYNIVDERDLRGLADTVEQFVATKAAEEKQRAEQKAAEERRQAEEFVFETTGRRPEAETRSAGQVVN